MRRVFVDTNVVIDFLSNRKPFSIAAAEIFNLAVGGKLKVYISAISYNNIYYILRQSITHTESLKLLNLLAGMTEIVDVTKAVIANSLKSDFKDFEDAIQYNCAAAVSKIDLIVTRDSKDFRKSDIPVMNPGEAIAFLTGI